MELVREVADSLMPGLKFTTDLPENYPNGKVPMLDLAVWIEKGTGEPGNGDKIRHTFYAKPSASPKVFHGKGAYPWRLKLITLAEEVT